MNNYKFLILLALSACADPYRNVYEGIEAQRQAQQTPMERQSKPAPSYDQYQRER